MPEKYPRTGHTGAITCCDECKRQYANYRRRVCVLGLQIADTLDAAHSKGIIHRDIKPSNIFIATSGRIKVRDFGLAKLLRDQRLPTSEGTPIEDSLTAVGLIPAGTAVYTSPEQARSEELDPRSDLFSFGVVLYEMATGKTPFTGANVVTTLDAVAAPETSGASLSESLFAH